MIIIDPELYALYQATGGAVGSEPRAGASAHDEWLAIPAPSEGERASDAIYQPVHDPYQ